MDKQALEVDRTVVEVAGDNLDPESSPPDDKPSMSLVGCGFPGDASGVELVIVATADQATKAKRTMVPMENETPAPGVALGEDQVGEIWIRSPSRADGYWGLMDKSKEDFGGRIDTGNRNSTEFKNGFGQPFEHLIRHHHT